MRSTTRSVTHRFLRPFSLVLGIGVLAGCGQSVVTDSSAHSPDLTGRWISVDVANATDTDHDLAVVHEREPTRVVGVADPATVLGHTTQQVRLFVPDDISWTLSSNGGAALYARDVDGWCGDLPVTIHIAEGIVAPAVPAFVHSGDGNCLGPVPPTRMTLYMRDQSVLGIGWNIMSGQRVEARGVVSEQPTAQCIMVPHDWALQFWIVEDFMDRPDRLAEMGSVLTAGEVLPDGDVTLAIDVEVTGLPFVSTDRVPDWWQGAEPDCP